MIEKDKLVSYFAQFVITNKIIGLQRKVQLNFIVIEIVKKKPLD